MLLVVIRPIIIGYSIYSDFKAQNSTKEVYKESFTDLNDQLMVITADKNSCEKYKTLLQKSVDNLTGQYQVMITESELSKTKLELSNAKLESELESVKAILEATKNTNNVEQKTLKNQLEDEKEKLIQSQNLYQKLAENAANNICCKQKVDNPDIDSYDIVSDKIVCLSGGSNSLACFTS